MSGTLRVWWRLRRAVARESRLPELLAVVAFAVATTALLVCAAGYLGFRARADAAPAFGRDQYVTLAAIACGLMVVPILTLGGVAARLAAARRDQRLSTLRLSGATSGQVVLMTLVEAAGQALVGGVLGVGLYGVLLPALVLLEFQGQAFTVGELWVGVPVAAVVLVGVVLLAVASGLVGLTRVVISPLGVSARVTPPALRLWRLAALGAALLAWFAVGSAGGQVSRMVVLTFLVGLIATVNLVGPYVVMLLGRVAAMLSRRLPTMLAARRLVDEPRGTWRAVSGLGFAMLVAGLSSFLAAADQSAPPAGLEHLNEDFTTGSYLTLAIVAVVTATSTGVVQAARVLDQREQYRALALTGATLRQLHAARTREVGLPLAVTVAVAGGLAVLVFVPYSAHLGVDLLVRFALAVLASAALMVGAVAVSRPLVRSVCQAPA